jgi:hypothetical protein
LLGVRAAFCRILPSNTEGRIHHESGALDEQPFKALHWTAGLLDRVMTSAGVFLCGARGLSRFLEESRMEFRTCVRAPKKRHSGGRDKMAWEAAWTVKHARLCLLLDSEIEVVWIRPASALIYAPFSPNSMRVCLVCVWCVCDCAASDGVYGVFFRLLLSLFPVLWTETFVIPVDHRSHPLGAVIPWIREGQYCFFSRFGHLVRLLSQCLDATNLIRPVTVVFRQRQPPLRLRR